MLNNFLAFLRDEEGASAVEYGLIVGLIAVVVAAVLVTIGGNLGTLFGTVNTCLEDPDSCPAAPAPGP